MWESVCAHVCVSGCVYVWLYACRRITVGVLVIVASCVWLFLLDFTILSLTISIFERHSTALKNDTSWLNKLFSRGYTCRPNQQNSSIMVIAWCSEAKFQLDSTTYEEFPHNVAESGRFLQWGSMGKLFIRCQICMKFGTRVCLKRWNDRGEFELDRARSKNNVAENSVALGYETHNTHVYLYWETSK